MKMTAGLVMALVSVVFFTWAQAEDSTPPKQKSPQISSVAPEKEPSASIATEANSPQAGSLEPGAPEAASPELSELIKLREKIGTPLKGRLLDEDPQATQEDFRKALEQVSKQPATDPAEVSQPSELSTEEQTPGPALVTPAQFDATEFPVERIPSGIDSEAYPDRLPLLLRTTSIALDARAGQLEILRDFENAKKLRRQAKKLRNQAILVESLSISNVSTIGVNESEQR